MVISGSAASTTERRLSLILLNQIFTLLRRPFRSSSTTPTPRKFVAMSRFHKVWASSCNSPLAFTPTLIPMTFSWTWGILAALITSGVPSRFPSDTTLNGPIVADRPGTAGAASGIGLTVSPGRRPGFGAPGAAGPRAGAGGARDQERHHVARHHQRGHKRPGIDGNPEQLLRPCPDSSSCGGVRISSCSNIEPSESVRQTGWPSTVCSPRTGSHTP